MGDANRKNQNNSKDNMVLTKETLGVVLMLFATLLLVCLVSGGTIFSAPGQYIKAFLLGLFGYFSYLVVLSLAVYGVLLIIDKEIPFSAKTKTLLMFGIMAVAVLSHVITMSGNELTYGEYLAESYLMGWEGLSTSSGGGLFVGVIAYPIALLLTDIGTYVVFGVLIALDGYALFKNIAKKTAKQKADKDSKFESSYVESEEIKQIDQSATIESHIGLESEQVVVQPKPAQKLFVKNPGDFTTKSNRELKKGDNVEIKLAVNQGGLNVSSAEQPYSQSYTEELKRKIDYIKMPSVIDVEKTISNDYSSTVKSIMRDESSKTTISDYVSPRKEEEQAESQVEPNIPMFEHETEKSDTAEAHAQNFAGKYAEVEELVDTLPIVNSPIIEEFRPLEAVEEEIISPLEQPSEEIVAEEIVEDIPFIEEIEEKIEEEKADETEIVLDQPQLPESNIISRRPRGIFFGEEKEEDKQASSTIEEKPSFTSRAQADGNLGSRSRGFDFASFKAQEEQKAKEEEAKKQKEIPPINRPYNRPPLDLLQTYAQTADQAEENHQEKQEIIKRTLAEFNINAEPQGFIQGPSITRYEIMMPAGVSVKKVLAFDDDLKMRLESKNGVRIEAPIPGKNLVGIEVANKHKVTVGLRQVLEGMASKKIKPSALEFAIGKDIVGNAISDDLAKGPHYLVAGATGSGKSVCLNAMIVSLIMRYSPEDLRLILIDPKRVGFRCYEHLPHLMIDEIITEPKKALAVLQWAYNEMENRYAMFEKSESFVSDIQAYNEKVASATVPKMPRIVVIVDELADLMETCKKDMEAKIRALAQKSRAAGIHLVLATQRPSVDIVTGTIKANLPSRIALKVMNFQDSQTILSEGGAEKLLGNGDMLYKNTGMADYERYQGAWISDAEINNVVSYIIENNKAYFDDELMDYLEKETKPKQDDSYGDSEDGLGHDSNETNEYFVKALWLAVTTQTISISQLQRRFQIGYARAGGLVDKMERMGFISGNEGSKARRVLLSREEFEARFGPMNDSGY